MYEYVRCPKANADQSLPVGKDQSLASVQLQPRRTDRTAWALSVRNLRLPMNDAESGKEEERYKESLGGIDYKIPK